MTRTNRWVGLAGAALLAVGAGVLFRSPGPVLAAAVAAGALAVRSTAVPPDPSLRVERDLENADPDPDEAVRVEVRVENEGSALFDLRLVDEVPDGLAVVEGPARHATALAPGDAAVFSYTVRATRGSHERSEERRVGKEC